MAACKKCFHYQACKGTYYEVKEQGEFDGEMYAECGCDDFLPTSDVVEVKHGHWIEEVGKIETPSGITIKALVGYRCSVCNRAEINKEPYCNCGAKMDGGS